MVGQALSKILRRVAAAAALAVAALLPLPALAAQDAEKIETQAPIILDADSARLIPLPEAANTVMTANPDIADVQVPNPTSFLLLAKKQGTTTVYVLTESGRTVSYPVTVRRDISQMLAALRAEVPGADIAVSGTPSGAVVSGSVDSPLEANRLRGIAKQYLGDNESLVFDVSVEESTQVNLRIRVAEVARDVDKRFGFNWNALFNDGTTAIGLLTGRAPVAAFGNFIRSSDNLDSIGFGYRGGNFDVSALIDALQEENLIQILAEPNLTALSGETANFLAGGEFPIPVAQGLQQITIEFKKFGVSVDFTPTVLNGNRMSIKVRSEVSELSDRGAIVVSDIRVPGLTVRRAETTVELASGQSFAIAGLFQNNVTSQVDQLPWLGDIPILGALFRSDRFQRNQSELVIIVTPYVVRPVSEISQLQLPSNGLDFANDLDQLLFGEMAPPGPAGTYPDYYRGPAGYMLE